MSIPVLKRRFTVEDYHKMAEIGVFKPNEKNELINGEIILMSPIGKRHAACVSRVSELFFSRLATVASVRVQNPITLDDFSEPQPDISLVKRRSDFYQERHPQPADIFLLVEVADTTIDFDLSVKIPQYCQSGIEEVWLVDLNQNCIRVYRTPTPNGYQLIQLFTAEQTLTLGAFPEVKINIKEILG